MSVQLSFVIIVLGYDMNYMLAFLFSEHSI